MNHSKKTPPPLAAEIRDAGSSPKKHPDLLIKVPNTHPLDHTPTPQTHSSGLRDGFSISSESEDSSRLSFDEITQLPTPIINNGSFGSFSPTETASISTSPIEVPKLRGKSSLLFKDRAISEYKPLGRKNSLSKDTLVEFKRVSSNPISKDKSPPSNIPSPPGDDFSRFDGHVFQSTHTEMLYHFEKVIGAGNFSTVVLASNVRNSLERVAIKIISIPCSNKSEVKNFKYFLKRELNILHQLHYPSIIRMLDYNINMTINIDEMLSTKPVESESDHDSDHVRSDIIHDFNNLQTNNDQLIFLNYCPGGNLFEFSSKHYHQHKFSAIYWKIVERVVIELLLSINYIHDHDIIHRDIKLENLLMNYDFDTLVDIVKAFPHLSTYKYPLTCLTDFGLAKKLSPPDKLISTRCGSQDYISPEILMGLKYDGRLTDAWSVGVFVYCLIENRLPFDMPPLSLIGQTGVSPSVIKRKMAKNTPAHRIAMVDWDWYAVNPLLEDVEDASKPIILNLQRLVEQLLVRKDKRMTVAQVLCDPRFAWIRENAPFV